MLVSDVNSFEQMIDELLGASGGEVIDRTRAVDHLLDLRIEAGIPALEFAVDAALRELPGRTMVAVTDWHDVLRGLLAAAALEADAVG
jgi:hypothetical protein